MSMMESQHTGVLQLGIDNHYKTKVKIMPEIEWITTSEAADLKGLTRHTIAEYCRRGTLVCQKRGRDWWVSKQSILDYESSSNAGRPRKKKEVVKTCKENEL